MTVRAVTASDAVKACQHLGYIVTEAQIRQWAARNQIKKLGRSERGNAMRYDMVGILAKVMPPRGDAA